MIQRTDDLDAKRDAKNDASKTRKTRKSEHSASKKLILTLMQI